MNIKRSILLLLGLSCLSLANAGDLYDPVKSYVAIYNSKNFDS